MPRANDSQGTRPPPDEGTPDALSRLVDVLAHAASLPPAELARRIHEVLPPAVAEIAESNRRLQDAIAHRESLVAAAAAELRAAAQVLLSRAGNRERAGEAKRLRGLAGDLERALSPAQDAAAARPSATPDTERPHLLVVDDDADARETLVQVLEPSYDVSTAADGAAGVESVRSDHPDLVLMDLFMPRLDGLQALERIREDPATSDIPVIFVSARADDAVKARTLDLGAVDYLQKPFSDRELLARVERALRTSRSQTALRELAQTDPLTGLANLRAFRARIDDEVKRARRYRTPLTCVMADMDHLKPVNDELGHAAGDRAIAAVASVIRGELRETDFGARYGGDEFVILLPHTTAGEGRVFAERVCARLKEAAPEIAGRRVPIGASFGVACFAEDSPEDGADALVRAADAALYRAKRAGRGRVVLGPFGAADGPRQEA